MRRESKQLERHLCSATVSETRRKAFSVKTLMEPQLKKTVKISSRWGKLRALSWGYITTLLLLRVFMRVCVWCFWCVLIVRINKEKKEKYQERSWLIQHLYRLLWGLSSGRLLNDEKKKKRCCDLWCIKQKTHVWSSDINRGENPGKWTYHICVCG